jgi:hypothetical protein
MKVSRWRMPNKADQQLLYSTTASSAANTTINEQSPPIGRMHHGTYERLIVDLYAAIEAHERVFMFTVFAFLAWQKKPTVRGGREDHFCTRCEGRVSRISHPLFAAAADWSVEPSEIFRQCYVGG